VQQSRFNVTQTMQEAVGLHQRGQFREAEKLYSRVLKAAPDNFDALHLLGSLKAQTGQVGEAFRLISAALKINPQSADALVNLANILHALKRPEEALASLDQALAINPGDLQAQSNRASAFLILGRPQEALDAVQAVLARTPRDVEALINCGNALAALGRTKEALARFDAALALAPNHPGGLYNRGNTLLSLDRPAEALSSFDLALKGMPGHAAAWNNRGRALQALNHHADAAASFDKAITLQKDYADAHFNLALAMLTAGDLKRGFGEYEWRWRRTGMPAQKDRGKPLWLGEYPLGRKTILLHAEQGLGDTIQFARYAPIIARSGPTVVVEAHAELAPLLSGLSGVASCHARGEPLPPYDLHCPLGSLPLALKTDQGSIPAEIPYLRADEKRIEAWRTAVEALPGKRIAIAWAGNPAHLNDRNRSIPLAILASLFAVPGASFVSIQRDLRDGDADLLAGGNVTHLGDKLTDMADTAAVTALCDLTIAVDTSVAHLAGALGKPLWVLLPFVPDWRWTLTGETTPWYPQARLFRQPKSGDWQSVIASIRAALHERDS
jgi:tetratricopeptide (TPR) repeat protein